MKNFIKLCFAAVILLPSVAYASVSEIAPLHLKLYLETLEQLLEDIQEALKIEQYFIARDMPLAGYGMVFAVGNNCGVDPYLLPAISVVESTGGKRMQPGTNNAWGWGSGLIKFPSFQDGILQIAERFCKSPLYAGKSTKEILLTYNPPSADPLYVSKVTSVMKRMEEPYTAPRAAK